jgi:transposase
MARPTKLTDEVEEEVLKAIRAGASLAAAAQFAGIDASTFYRWTERGDLAGTGRADARFRRFRTRVEQARAQAEVRDVTIIAKASERDWRAAAWRLERRNPQRYGRAAVAEALPGEVGYGRAADEAANDEQLGLLARVTRPSR